jgi:hypothetical protein
MSLSSDCIDLKTANPFDLNDSGGVLGRVDEVMN